MEITLVLYMKRNVNYNEEYQGDLNGLV